MIGVYKITNLTNGMYYIGASVDIRSRWIQHKANAFNSSCKEYGKPLYQAMRQDGVWNFTLEVLEECNVEALQEKEIYWIATLNAIQNGYNQTPGGIGVLNANSNDKHPNHKLTLEDVIDIRTAYNNRERKRDVYKKYSGRINKTGFHKIWNGTTWPSIMPEVYNAENTAFHTHNTANAGTYNGRAILTEDDVRLIRQRRKNGERLATVYQDYASKVTFGYFENVWSYQNWKSIVV